ncbi:MAG: site-specific integrase, partial [Nitrospirales bacterium]
VLNLAVRDEKLHRNPMFQVSLPKVSKGCVRYLSLEEEQALREQIGTTYAPWIRFAVLTGLRRSEQFRLKWGDIDQVRGLITLHTTKAGHGQYVHMSQEAQAVVETLKAGNTSVWVFPGQNPDTPIEMNSFYQRVYLPAVKAAKLDAVTWHTLRHTFASRLAMGGASDGDIAASLRHAGTALVKRYTHLSPSHLKGVMEKASAFGQPAGQGSQEGQIGSGTVSLTGTGAPEPDRKEAEVVD